LAGCVAQQDPEDDTRGVPENDTVRDLETDPEAETEPDTEADSYYVELAEEFAEHGTPPHRFIHDSASDALDAFETYGGTEQRITVGDSVPFDEAIRLEVQEGYDTVWHAGTYYENDDPPGAGTCLWVAWLRHPSESPSDDTATVEASTPTEDELFNAQAIQNERIANLRAKDEWTRCIFYGGFPIDVEDWTFSLGMGLNEQTVDIGGLAILHSSETMPYSPADTLEEKFYDFRRWKPERRVGSVSFDDFPDWDPNYEYPGRAEDADWRAEAQDRIEEVRMAPIDVTVVDSTGDPVPDATVDIEMQEHEFEFGSALSVEEFQEGPEEYRERFLENFNKATIEKGLKPAPWEQVSGGSTGGQPPWGPPPDKDWYMTQSWSGVLNPGTTRETIEWLLDQDISVRGHMLFWDQYNTMVIDEDADEESIKETVAESIADRAGAFTGDLDEWDMHNHPIADAEIVGDIGKDALLEWWDVAQEADDHAEMYVNEAYCLPSTGRFRQKFQDHIDWLLENDAPVDGIGLMGHFFEIGKINPPEELYDALDEFAEFGLPLQITEFDVDIFDREDDVVAEAQTDYVRDFLTVAFSHEAVEGITVWGFWSGSHWKPNSALYGDDWTLRSQGEQYQELVFDEWWTDETDTTGTSGEYSTRGYKGSYEITVSHDGDSESTTAVLDDDGLALDMQV